MVLNMPMSFYLREIISDFFHNRTINKALIAQYIGYQNRSLDDLRMEQVRM